MLLVFQHAAQVSMGIQKNVGNYPCKEWVIDKGVSCVGLCATEQSKRLKNKVCNASWSKSCSIATCLPTSSSNPDMFRTLAARSSIPSWSSWFEYSFELSLKQAIRVFKCLFFGVRLSAYKQDDQLTNKKAFCSKNASYFGVSFNHF